MDLAEEGTIDIGNGLLIANGLTKKSTVSGKDQLHSVHSLF